MRINYIKLFEKNVLRGRVMNTDLNTKKFYESKKQSKFFSADKNLQKPEIAILEKYINKIKDQNILDIGCGGGRTTEHLRKFSANYTGINYSTEMISCCKMQYPSLTFIQRDVRDLSIFENNSFDFIFFSFNGIDSINHEGRTKALNEIYRVLKPDGLFVFSAHNLHYKNIPYIPRIFTSLNPVVIAKNVIKRVIYIKNSKKEVHTEEYSIINCPSNAYLGYTYYINKGNQVKQLEKNGFKVLDIVDRNGKFVDSKKYDSDNLWFYYVCQK